MSPGFKDVFNNISALPAAIAVPDSGPLTERAHDEPPHPYRTPFARDGARILHARAFRRLAGKTQVFTRLPADRTSDLQPSLWVASVAGDHFRSRLTHTLEVTQIARTLATTLGLNVELAEALARVHDIGHPPFGHAGEKALDAALKPYGLGFDHNLHALRIVTWFEERYAAFRGLNLTLAVREGIIKHSRDYAPSDHPELAEYFLDQRPPIEAQLIDLADEIAYLTADLDDGLDSGILTFDQVRENVPLFRRFHDAAQARFPHAASRLLSSEAIRKMFNALVTDLMREVRAQVDAQHLATLDDVRRAPNRIVALSAEMEAERAAAKNFLYENLYNSPGMEDVHQHATEVVSSLFARLMADESLLPEDHRAQIPWQGLARTVTDYIAGMTDSFIEQMWMRTTRE
jgi:dGTPase